MPNEGWVPDVLPLLELPPLARLKSGNEVVNLNGRKLTMCNRIDSHHLRVRPNLGKEPDDRR